VNEARSRRRHAVRVAGIATLVVMACYVIAAVVLNVVVTRHLIGTIDNRLGDRLEDAARQTLTLPGGSSSPPKGTDVDDAPVFLWSVAPSGDVTAIDPGSPTLPAHSWGSGPVTLGEGTSTFRFDTLHARGGLLVAGQSVANVSNVQSTLFVAEVVFGALLAVAVFAGALIVGLRASAPSEMVRRRQAEFTADASHELRTPISVMEAEIDLALSRPRDASAYRDVLDRLRGESRRLRDIVEDLLWLARADDEPLQHDPHQVSDVADVVDACVHRFAALAESHGVVLEAEHHGDSPFTVYAPSDLLDRLVGVLIDNACKFAGEGGRVLASVSAGGHHVELRVDDSGPGIPEEQREAVFDRFHRGSAAVGGTGLGLAIADSVVRATQGEWAIGIARLGGARMAVRWRKAPGRRGRLAPSANENLTKSLS
jgi:signal transduction histidine kinase